MRFGTSTRSQSEDLGIGNLRSAEEKKKKGGNDKKESVYKKPQCCKTEQNTTISSSFACLACTLARKLAASLTLPSSNSCSTWEITGSGNRPMTEFLFARRTREVGKWTDGGWEPGCLAASLGAWEEVEEGAPLAAFWLCDLVCPCRP